jgi:hypothetical protein
LKILRRGASTVGNERKGKLSWREG